MIEEDDRPRAPKPTPPNLEPLGVEELRAYISELKAEIARAEAVIARKDQHRSASDALFRRPS
jgi:uncharacterized small protein (DUF1192 family)